MQWILQEFEDTKKLADALDRLGAAYSFHKVIPFIGELEPEPSIADLNAVVLFGSYTLWRYAERHNLKPGVFRIEPFIREAVWQPFLLNGADARFMTVREIPEKIDPAGPACFMRPVADSKEVAGRIYDPDELIDLAKSVLTLDPEEIPGGSLGHDTELMLTKPVRIQREWRVWVVKDEVVTWSLYKEGSRVVYRPEIDDDAREFAERMVIANPHYADAYVIDICRVQDGLKIIETNCINAAGYYAADLVKLAGAIEALGQDSTQRQSI